MKYWEQNRKILETYYPGLAEKLEQSEDDWEGPLEIRGTPSGLPTLLVQGMHIHSPRDPAAEARRIAAAEPGDGPVAVFGFGLGYLPEAIAGTAPGRPLIILEKHPKILQKALEERDLTELLSRNRIVFVVGGSPEGITGALQLFSEPPAVLKNRNLVSLDESWYRDAENHLRAFAQRDEVNAATLRRFGRRWVRNLAKNREAIRDLPGIRFLAGSGRGFPVFLAAAGPSLDDIAPLLPEIRERCIVIAVDTSLRMLLRRGIEPDFAVSVDPQFWNARHLDRCDAPGCCLIAESAVYPQVLRRGFRRKLLCSSLFPLGRFIEDRVDPKGVLGAGGSVATSAWDFARILGSAEIWIAGLDLSFPDLKTHFSGALFEARFLAEAHRLRPAETYAHLALHGGFPFKAAAAGSGQVLTDRRLSMYAGWFERQFRNYPEIKSYLLSGRGLAIKGAAAAAPEDILSLPPRRGEIDARLAETFGAMDGGFGNPEAQQGREKQFNHALEELRKELDRIIAVSESAAAAAREAWKNASLLSPERREAVLAELDSANHTIIGSAAKDVAGFLFPPIEELESALKTPGQDPFRSHLELSFRLYEALAEAAEYNRKYL
ncbi:motility associated factor glycosyltransferase family protein [Breznakiella homolactica]|uniref:Motility associated factor glycosyltransferase family protein n=1 Tax=Breznakiella homolactica TaxID=2798577 RepID=A0A7T7XKY4_9SPIR|nr:6-hydroxymethylpterin diphosphokinase MptE-like protein [Breznakiella homolactica]QQO08325.1 DUF115 domain-containing protein [Breznakiella homolactica]